MTGPRLVRETAGSGSWPGARTAQALLGARGSTAVRDRSPRSVRSGRCPGDLTFHSPRWGRTRPQLRLRPGTEEACR